MKKHSHEWWRKKCVNYAKKIRVQLQNGICEKCGRSREAGYVMHGSHIYPEGKYRNMSADLNNILCLCYYCHFQWWHKHPVDAGEWFTNKYPERAKMLKTISQLNIKVWWENYYQKLIENNV
jgi:hypothetical protein